MTASRAKWLLSLLLSPEVEETFAPHGETFELEVQTGEPLNEVVEQTDPLDRFCKLCHIAGKALTVCRSHDILQCRAMSDRDKKRILTSLAAGDAEDYEEEDDNTPLGDIRVPGWDDEETNANNNLNIYNDEIHDNPYAYVTHLNTIIPYPSQVLRVLFQNIHIPITLDSGATVSYILYDLVKQMAIPIHPNNQLVALADGTTKKSSLGEIDTSVSISGHKLRLRALVMKHLHVPCFGGTTFHRDNKIVANLNEHNNSQLQFI